jgi:hypothetical protein
MNDLSGFYFLLRKKQKSTFVLQVHYESQILHLTQIWTKVLCVPQREFQLRFGNFFLTLGTTFIMDRKKRLRYPHTPNEAAMDYKRRREEPCII